MEAIQFGLEGMIKVDVASCLPLEPFMITLCEMLECRGYRGIDMDKLKEQLVGLIRLNTGRYETHEENGVTFVHGVCVGEKIFSQMPSNSMGLLENTQNVEWFNLMNSDDSDFHGKGRFMYMLGLGRNDEDMVEYGYMDGNYNTRYNDEGVVELRNRSFCKWPCLRPEDVNTYLVEEYQCHVSAILDGDKPQQNEDNPDMMGIRMGYRVLLQQSIHSSKLLFEKEGTIVNGFYNLMIGPICCSPLGAYSLGFRYLYNKIIDYSIKFK